MEGATAYVLLASGEFSYRHWPSLAAVGGHGNP
jgi:hypothetical protein